MIQFDFSTLPDITEIVENVSADDQLTFEKDDASTMFDNEMYNSVILDAFFNHLNKNLTLKLYTMDQ